MDIKTKQTKHKYYYLLLPVTRTRVVLVIADCMLQGIYSMHHGAPGTTSPVLLATEFGHVTRILLYYWPDSGHVTQILSFRWLSVRSDSAMRSGVIIHCIAYITAYVVLVCSEKLHC